MFLDYFQFNFATKFWTLKTVTEDITKVQKQTGKKKQIRLLNLEVQLILRTLLHYKIFLKPFIILINIKFLDVKNNLLFKIGSTWVHFVCNILEPAVISNKTNNQIKIPKRRNFYFLFLLYLRKATSGLPFFPPTFADIVLGLFCRFSGFTILRSSLPSKEPKPIH